MGIGSCDCGGCEREWYAELVSVEYRQNPFRTFIVEQDPVLGMRETSLYGTLNQIDSEVTTGGKIRNSSNYANFDEPFDLQEDIE